jgi:hypothetical protein
MRVRAICKVRAHGDKLREFFGNPKLPALNSQNQRRDPAVLLRKDAQQLGREAIGGVRGTEKQALYLMALQSVTAICEPTVRRLERRFLFGYDC